MKSEKKEFVFNILLWGKNGNVLLFKGQDKVLGSDENDAKSFIKRLYPTPYSVELSEVNEISKI